MAAPQMLVNTDSTGVRISEIHYDNTGADAGERIEVSAPATHDFFGWRVVLYNGADGLQYGSILLPFMGGTVCGDRKVVVVNGPSAGIQNGAPDGIALVDANNNVIEFLSYEGTFTAGNGPALGILSTDIAVAQNGTEALGSSLQRQSYTNSWIATNGTNTFNACNDNGPPPPPPDVASVTVIPSSATIDIGGTQQFLAQARDQNGQIMNGVTFTWSSSAPAVATVNTAGMATGVLDGNADIMATALNGAVGTATLTVNAPQPPPGLPAVRFSEIHYDNAGIDVGEAIEIEGPADTDLTNWRIVLYNGNGGVAYHTRILSGVIDGSCANVPGRGIAYFEYPTDGIQNGSPDGFALVDATGAVVEFLSYEGSFAAADGPAAGMTSQDLGVVQASTNPSGQTLQRKDDGTWAGPQAANIGGCNSGGPVQRAKTISFTGRTATDPALPIGFEDQVFASLNDLNAGTTVATTFTWSSDDPAVASIDQDGVFRALNEGTALLRATATDGTTGTYALPTRVATASVTAQYGGHVEFGMPTDADNSDDFIVARPQYVVSFNGSRGIPNWAAYNLEQSHFGSEDRCDCFTYDPELPFTKYTTADYTGAGAFHGYGIDRGHLVRSFDREAGSLDNAVSFYFSNIVPQAADNNQGPWADLENELGAFAQSGNHEVYIIAGASGSKGTVKDEGLITIPTHMWKVAIVMGRNQGLSDVHGFADVQIFAAIIPNEAGIRNQPWETYRTTVDAVEALSGYDLLSSLPDHIETALESNNRPPVGVANGPYTSNEGSPVGFSAAGSNDPDGGPLTYAWSFGDGGSSSDELVTHTYTQDGVFHVRLILTDVQGLADTVFTTATVANVAPLISPFDGAMLLPGERFTTVINFLDPGLDFWTAYVSYGDDSAEQSVPIENQRFTISKVYGDPGEFTVTVKVADDDTTTTATQTVVVLDYTQALDKARAMINQLVAAGRLSNPQPYLTKLDGAAEKLKEGDRKTAANKLEALVSDLDALVSSGRLTAAEVQPLRSLLERTLISLLNGQSAQPLKNKKR